MPNTVVKFYYANLFKVEVRDSLGNVVESLSVNLKGIPRLQDLMRVMKYYNAGIFRDTQMLKVSQSDILRQCQKAYQHRQYYEIAI